MMEVSKLTQRLPVFLGALGLLLALGCQGTNQNSWPWWTDQDRAEVRKELDAWRDSITARVFIEGGMEGLIDSARIIGRDSVSPTGDSMIKVAHLTGFGFRADNIILRDSLLFGVTADTLVTESTPGDTFCHVIATDTASNSFAYLGFDRYYSIKYRADTTVSPPETTITYRLDTVATKLYSETRQNQKDIPLVATRYLHLKKEGSSYHLRRMSGFSVYLPTTTDGPALSWVAVTYRGVVDTYRLAAQENGTGIYNLRDTAGLPHFRKGESLAVLIKATAPSLPGDQYYFLARIGGTRILLARDSLMAEARRIAFPEAGLKHLTVEVIPQSNLLYPGTPFTGTVWSLPVRVTE